MNASEANLRNYIIYLFLKMCITALEMLQQPDNKLLYSSSNIYILQRFLQEPYGRPADWWSLGLVLFQMLSARVFISQNYYFIFNPNSAGYCYKVTTLAE